LNPTDEKTPRNAAFQGSQCGTMMPATLTTPWRRGSSRTAVKRTDPGRCRFLLQKRGVNDGRRTENSAQEGPEGDNPKAGFSARKIRDEEGLTKRWSQRVTQESGALDLKRGVFTLRDLKRIAASLKRSAERSSRRKAGAYRSALSMDLLHQQRRQNFAENPARTAATSQARIEAAGRKGLMRRPGKRRDDEGVMPRGYSP
jgi:hypothetical protein